VPAPASVAKNSVEGVEELALVGAGPLEEVLEILALLQGQT